MFSIWLAVLLLFPFPLSHQSDSISSNVAEISLANFNSTLRSYDVVFINFYADWCHFSKRLAPIFEEAAVRIVEQMLPKGAVLLARVNCIREVGLSKICGINKYPTLRLYYRGEPLRQEYRGQRSVEALVSYVLKELRSGIRTLTEDNQLDAIDGKGRTVIGYFTSTQQLERSMFELFAARYRGDCDFYMKIGETAEDMARYAKHIPAIVFRTQKGEEIYWGNASVAAELEKWIYTKCVPLVREVSFENVEDLIEQRLPLLILFHMPNDVISVRDFRAVVELQLSECYDCGRFNYVTVDGVKFQHSVLHMGKSMKDLPLIAIDSLHFIYSYARFQDIYIPGHLMEFIRNFNNHRMRPDRPNNLVAIEQVNKSPPPSTFKDLGPSKHRYTLFKHDEL